VHLGEGTHTFIMLIADTDLMKDIMARTDSRTALELYIPGAAERLDLNGYRANVSLEAEELSDDYWVLTQTVSLIGGGQATYTNDGEHPDASDDRQDRR